MPLPNDIVTASLKAAQPGAWEGSLTGVAHRSKGAYAFEVEGITVSGVINQVQQSQADGVSTYTFTVGRARDASGRPLEDALNAVIPITHHTPRDPVAELEETNACLDDDGVPLYIDSQTMFAMRAGRYRPTAGTYLGQAAGLAGVTLVIESDVIGAQSKVPFREWWDGAGSTIGGAIGELFGFAKPEVYVNASGWIIVRRSPTPAAFGTQLSNPETRVLTDLTTENESVQVTCYASAREWLCAYFGSPL